MYPINCSLEEYLQAPYEIDNSKIDKNKYRLMLDVFGEADRAIHMEGSKQEDIKLQLRTLHDVCNEIYANRYMDDQLKHDLRKKEWGLNHLLLDQKCYEDSKNDIISWFNYWCFEIELEWLVDEEK